jgi:hypothetical protein
VEIKRKEIAQLTEYKKGNPGRKLERKAQQILENTGHTRPEIEPTTQWEKLLIP